MYRINDGYSHSSGIKRASSNKISTQPMASPSSSTPFQIGDHEVECLALLLDLIESRNWEAFEFIITSNPTVFASFAMAVQRSSHELNGMTILHASVRFDPPPRIVELLVELVPDSPSRVDCVGRTPLHVAAGSRASPALMGVLARAHPRACATRDDDGKTPLHLACDNECDLFEGGDEDEGGEERRLLPREPPSYDVVRALVKVDPLCVPLEDYAGMSALEHAIISNAPIRVVKLLQYVTKKQCEKEDRGDRCSSGSRRVSQDSKDEDSIVVMTTMERSRRISQDSRDDPPSEVSGNFSVEEQISSLDEPSTPSRAGMVSKRRRRGVILNQMHGNFPYAA